MSERRTRALSLVLLATVCVQALAFWAAGAAAQTEGGKPLLREVGALSRFPADARAALGPLVVPELPLPEKPGNLYLSIAGKVGTLLPLPAVGQLWQLWIGINEQATGFTGTYVVVRDPDSLKIIHSFKLSHQIPLRGAIGGYGGDWIHAIDIEGKRLFLLIVGSLLVVDLTDFSTKYLPISFTGDRSYQPVRTNGLSWDPVGRRLWTVWGKEATSFDPFSVNYLVRMNPDPPDGSPAVDGPSKVLRGCRGPLPGLHALTSQRYSSQILREGEYLHIPCHRDLGNVAIALLHVDEALDPAKVEDLLVGPSSAALSVLADEKGGRLHFLTDDSQDWVWDARSRAFVGYVGLGTGPNVGSAGKLSLGLDEDSGRLYFNSMRFGLGYVEGRYTPVGQAAIFPEFAASESSPVPFERIFVDSRNRRIFALPNLDPTRDATYYRIIEVPPPVPPQAFPNPDQNTVDISEQVGLTTADFVGSAGGYGVRVLLAGGFIKAIPMPVLGFDNFRSPSLIFELVNSKCGYTDRELAAGYIGDAKMTTRSSRVVSLGFFLDQQSQQNLRVPSQCDLEIPLASPTFNGLFGAHPLVGDALNSALGQDWKPAFASCSLPGSEPTSDPGDPPLGRASASCPVDPQDVDQSLTAEALGSLEGPQLSGSGYSKVTIYRDRDRGLVSRAESVARGVTFGLPGDPSLTVSFEEIRSVAESWSKGRPSKSDDPKRSERKVTISGFVGPDGTRCREVTVPATPPGAGSAHDTCDIGSVLDALNTVFVGRAYFRQPEHDPVLFGGTPKGAQSAVQKSDAQVASDRVTAGDASSEVAGLEIITYNDTPPWGRARQIYQLAGVKTASTYNISCLLGEPSEGGQGDGEACGGKREESRAIPVEGGVLEQLPPLPPQVLASSIRPLSLQTQPKVVGRIADGIRWLLSSPWEAARMATAWLLFLAPLLVAGRRRLLRTINPAPRSLTSPRT